MDKEILLRGPYEVYNESKNYVVKDIHKKKYIYLNELDYSIFIMLKDGKTVTEIKDGYLNRYGIDINKNINDLIDLLKRAGFIDTYEVEKKVKNQISFSGFDEILCLIYKCLPKILFKKVTFIILCVFNVSIIIAYLVNSAYIIKASSFNMNAFVILWVVINIILHEFAHAIVCKHYKREVISAGIKLNYGFPVLFINTTDMIMMKKRCRILVSCSAIFVNVILGSLIYILYYLTGNYSERLLIVYCTTFSYIMAIFNLIPFFKLDGYYILSDILGVTNLQTNAKRYFKKQLIKDILRKNIDRYTIIYTSYYLLSIVFSLNVVYIIIITVYKSIKQLIY